MDMSNPTGAVLQELKNIGVEINSFTKENVKDTLEKQLSLFEDMDVSPATQLLDKRRQILDLSHGLFQEKETFRIRMEFLAQQRQEFQRKELMFADTVNRFETFLEDNDAKRNRAIKKAHDEKKLRECKIAEVTKLKDGLAYLVTLKQQQEQAMLQGQYYQRYLESILETAEGFSEIKDLLSRYDALFEANQELFKRLKIVQGVHDQLRQAFQVRTEEQHTTILNKNNALAQKKLKLEELAQKTIKWQTVIDQSVQKATQQSLEVGQIQLATNNLFLLVKAHLNHRISGTNDTLVQLDKIQQFILDLAEIVNVG